MTASELPPDLVRIEQYYDLQPRAAATTEEHGAFTLFVSTGAWPYYARPRLGHIGPFSASDVKTVWNRQEELAVPVSFEWVGEVSPGLAQAISEAGLVVEERPLLMQVERREIPPPQGISIRFLEARDADLARAVAAVDMGFGTPGSDIGPVGAVERDEHAAAMRDSRLSYFRDRIERGVFRWASADDSSGPVGGGSYHPRVDVAEITGIGTLPSVRRRGIGAAVTATLAADAAAHGVTLTFLSAGSVGAARVYERAGFRRIGTACVAAPPATPG